MKIAEIIEKVTLPLKYKLVLSIGTGFLVLLPEGIVQKYFGFAIEGPIRISIGIVFLIFSSFSIVEIVINLGTRAFNEIRGRRYLKKANVKIIENLLSLTEKEKEYVATYQRDNTITQSLPINDGITQSLIGKKIIYVSSKISKSGFYFPCNLNQIVWEYLEKNTEFFKEIINQINERRSLY